MNILTWFMESVWSNNLMLIFVILVLGYALGRITICGLDLGTAGVLLVALVFGHFGVTIPDVVGDLGLICFVTERRRLVRLYQGYHRRRRKGKSCP